MILLWSLELSALNLVHSDVPARASENLLDSLNSETAGIVREVRPSLLTVESYYKRGTMSTIHAAVATGILYTQDGYIVTTATLVRPNRTYRIRDHFGRSHQGTLIGTDRETNLAVIKIEATDLSPARFGDSRGLKEGSWVAVLADAYELPSSVGLGVFNGRRSSDGLLQLSMNLSPASIGGAVVNSGGEVIGMLTAKGSEIVSLDAQRWLSLRLSEKLRERGDNSASRKAATTVAGNPPTKGRYQFSLPSSGIGLALPVEMVRDVADELIQFGEVRRGFLGISQMNITPEMKHRYGLEQGVVVTTVAENSPAAQAGLRSGDVITRFNDQPVVGTQKLFNLVRSSKPGREVRLVVLRGEKPLDLRVVLGEVPEAYRNQGRTLNLPDWFPFEPDLRSATALEDHIKAENQRLRRQVEYLRQQLLEMQKELKEVKSQLDNSADDL